MVFNGINITVRCFQLQFCYQFMTIHICQTFTLILALSKTLCIFQIFRYTVKTIKGNIILLFMHCPLSISKTYNSTVSVLNILNMNIYPSQERISTKHISVSMELTLHNTQYLQTISAYLVSIITRPLSGLGCCESLRAS